MKCLPRSRHVYVQQQQQQCQSVSAITRTQLCSENYAGPSYSRTNIYAVRGSYAADDARCSSKADGDGGRCWSIAARAQQQTSRTSLLLSIDGTDRRTDGHSTVLGRFHSILCGPHMNSEPMMRFYRNLKRTEYASKRGIGLKMAFESW